MKPANEEGISCRKQGSYLLSNLLSLKVQVDFCVNCPNLLEALLLFLHPGLQNSRDNQLRVHFEVEVACQK